MLRVEGLNVTFPEGQAVRGAGLVLAPGDRLGIVGESGSGKTLLGLSLLGMAPEAAQVSGSIRLEDAELVSASERQLRRLRGRRVAMVFQEPLSALNPLRRVGDLIGEPLRVHLRLSRRAARARALELLEEVGLPEPEARLRQFPHELSGGQRQRVMIALALACDPVLLIADEPTTALDAAVAVRILELLARLSEKRGMGLILISHDLTAIARVTSRLAVMYGGDIVEAGPTAALLEDPQHPYTKGLIAARPRLDPDRDRRRPLATIPGSVPPLGQLPQGCRFAGRCTVELGHCSRSRPELVAVKRGGAAACLHLEAEP
ncbi:MAG: ABC transporter ATP-binding protein [Paracoccaceae bacterium]